MPIFFYYPVVTINKFFLKITLFLSDFRGAGSILYITHALIDLRKNSWHNQKGGFYGYRTGRKRTL